MRGPDRYYKAKLILIVHTLPSQVRAFVKNIEGTGKQELNQSPLPFVETAAQPGEAHRVLPVFCSYMCNGHTAKKNLLPFKDALPAAPLGGVLRVHSCFDVGCTHGFS
jgi:hypothetical protein